MAGWHSFVRFDNGQVVWNVEATNTEGGFRVHPDSFYKEEYRVPQEHIECGSDLTFLKPRQLVGDFFGSRGRHYWDIQDIGRATHSFDLALRLYPQSRLYQRMLRQCKMLQNQPDPPALYYDVIRSSDYFFLNSTDRETEQ
jgi:hypothetical protein